MRVQQIQQEYPNETDWALEADTTLIELVQGHVHQPDCAGDALRELAQRKHEAVGDLSVALLLEADADKWLKLEAFRSLPVTHMAQGFSAARSLVDTCPAVVMEMLAAAMHYHLQEEMPDMLRSHDVVKKLGSGHYWGNGNVIHFAGSVTRNEFLQAEQLMRDKTLSARVAALLLAVWAMLAGMLSLMDHAALPSVMMLLLGLALGGIAYALKIKELAWDNDPNFRNHYYGTINEDGIDTHGKNTWHFLAWQDMTGWAASDDMLVVSSPGGARVFSVPLFASWTEWEQARDLCAVKLPKMQTKARWNYNKMEPK